MRQTDIRGYEANPQQLAEAETVRDWQLSQSEIVEVLRQNMHTHGVYTLEQLIHDVENLTPELLDTHASRKRRAATD